MLSVLGRGKNQLFFGGAARPISQSNNTPKYMESNPFFFEVNEQNELR